MSSLCPGCVDGLCDEHGLSIAEERLPAFLDHCRRAMAAERRFVPAKSRKALFSQRPAGLTVYPVPLVSRRGRMVRLRAGSGQG